MEITQVDNHLTMGLNLEAEVGLLAPTVSRSRITPDDEDVEEESEGSWINLARSISLIAGVLKFGLWLVVEDVDGGL
jgi:hypothetical protein